MMKTPFGICAILCLLACSHAANSTTENFLAMVETKMPQALYDSTAMFELTLAYTATENAGFACFNETGPNTTLAKLAALHKAREAANDCELNVRYNLKYWKTAPKIQVSYG